MLAVNRKQKSSLLLVGYSNYELILDSPGEVNVTNHLPSAGFTQLTVRCFMTLLIAQRISFNISFTAILGIGYYIL